jgi:hypothetical protein
MFNLKICVMKTSRFIPSNLTETMPFDNGIIYYSESDLSAMSFIGKAVKPAFYYSYRKQNLDYMLNSLKKYVGQQNNWFAEKNKRLAEQKQAQSELKAGDHYKIGDIIYNSWGYEQTNIDFYQVVEVLNKKIRVKAISKNYKESQFMAGHSTPIKNSFSSDEKGFLLTVRISGKYVCLSGGASYYSFHMYENKPLYESHYA